MSKVLKISKSELSRRKQDGRAASAYATAEAIQTPAPKNCDLKVWHIPQVPGKPFEVVVGGLLEGKLLLDTLAQYDIFQFENKIKPDYCNAQGLMVFEDGEWIDWESDEGEDIHEWVERIDKISARIGKPV